jgi:hypothetical protein
MVIYDMVVWCSGPDATGIIDAIERWTFLKSNIENTTPIWNLDMCFFFKITPLVANHYSRKITSMLLVVYFSDIDK